MKTAHYFKANDGWHAKLREGAKIIRHHRVDSKEAAIAATKALLEEFSDTTLKLCLLGECWAWETPDGWVYSREPDGPGAGSSRFVEGARPVSQLPAKPPEFMPGAPRHFRYPKPTPISDEDQKRYDEIHAKIVEKLKQQKDGRRSRWQPPT